MCAPRECAIQGGFWQLGVIIRPMNRTNEPHVIGCQGCQREGRLAVAALARPGPLEGMYIHTYMQKLRNFDLVQCIPF